MTEADRVARLAPPGGRVSMVLDTDTYNEIDDQFALVYALLSKERLDVEAIYAAPFHNERSSGPADGMEKSYAEILELLKRMGRSPDGFVFRGSRSYLPAADCPVDSAAVDDLVARAMAQREGPLYVVAIGAITNVASAILKEPAIKDRIVVAWLGGQPYTWPDARDFNLGQDLFASRLVFDCGVPLVHVPCRYVAESLKTTVPELDAHVRGHSAVGDYLCDSFAAYTDDTYAWAKEIWDLGPVAWLVNPDWTISSLVPSPVLTDECTWSKDPSRHTIRVLDAIDRNAVFRDLFRKLERLGA
jgi:inosine-uridine nucleoside N-ribohydrolase